MKDLEAQNEPRNVPEPLVVLGVFLAMFMMLCGLDAFVLNEIETFNTFTLGDFAIFTSIIVLIPVAGGFIMSYFIPRVYRFRYTIWYASVVTILSIACIPDYRRKFLVVNAFAAGYYMMFAYASRMLFFN